MSRLYRQRIPGRVLLLLVLSALVAIVAALAASPVGTLYYALAGDWWDKVVFWIQGLFT